MKPREARSGPRMPIRSSSRGQRSDAMPYREGGRSRSQSHELCENDIERILSLPIGKERLSLRDMLSSEPDPLYQVKHRSSFDVHLVRSDRLHLPGPSPPRALLSPVTPSDSAPTRQRMMQSSSSLAELPSAARPATVPDGARRPNADASGAGATSPFAPTSRPSTVPEGSQRPFGTAPEAAGASSVDALGPTSAAEVYRSILPNADSLRTRPSTSSVEHRNAMQRSTSHSGLRSGHAYAAEQSGHSSVRGASAIGGTASHAEKASEDESASAALFLQRQARLGLSLTNAEHASAMRWQRQHDERYAPLPSP